MEGPTGPEGPTGSSYNDYDNTKKIKDLDYNDIYKSTLGTYWEINKNNIYQLQHYQQIGTIKDNVDNVIVGYVIINSTDMREENIRVLPYPLKKYLNLIGKL